MVVYCLVLLERMKVDRKGVTALEYGVIVAAIVAAISGVVLKLGTTLAGLFTSMATSL
jgi:Flp pilus assembly pilin Flp